VGMSKTVGKRYMPTASVGMAPVNTRFITAHRV
jgi:hypothetical protein